MLATMPYLFISDFGLFPDQVCENCSGPLSWLSPRAFGKSALPCSVEIQSLSSPVLITFHQDPDPSRQDGSLSLPSALAALFTTEQHFLLLPFLMGIYETVHNTLPRRGRFYNGEIHHPSSNSHLYENLYS